MGLGRDMQLIMSGIINMTQLVGVTSSLWTMDSIGRRALLLTGSVLMAISHIIIATFVSLYGEDWPSHRPEGWASVGLLFFYMLAFGCSWGPVPWGMPSGTYETPETLLRHASNIKQKYFPLLYVPKAWLSRRARIGSTISLS